MDGRFPTAYEFEQFAAARMRSMGFTDAQATEPGPDGGFDVVSSRGLAQVKAHMKPVGRPALQNLVGAAHGDSRALCFFSIQGYTAAAIEYAQTSNIALFTLDVNGASHPANETGRRLVLAASQPSTPTASAVRNRGQRASAPPARVASKPSPARAASDVAMTLPAMSNAIRDWQLTIESCPSPKTVVLLRKAETELLAARSALWRLVQATGASTAAAPLPPSVRDAQAVDSVPRPTAAQWVEEFRIASESASERFGAVAETLGRPEFLAASADLERLFGQVDGAARMRAMQRAVGALDGSIRQWHRLLKKAARRWNREHLSMRIRMR